MKLTANEEFIQETGLKNFAKYTFLYRKKLLKILDKNLLDFKIEFKDNNDSKDIIFILENNKKILKEIEEFRKKTNNGSIGYLENNKYLDDYEETIES